MAKQVQDGALQQLRRHQYLLINGGGLLITAVVLIACVLELWASAREHLNQVQEEVSIDARRISELNARTAATLRNNVQNIELALKVAAPQEPQLLKQYWDGLAILRVQSQSGSSSVLVVGDPSSAHTEEAWTYIRLAKIMSPALSVIIKRNAGELTSYLLSADERFVLMAVAPWPGDAWQQKLVQQRAQLTKYLRHGEGLLPTHVRTSSVPSLQWLPSRQSLITDKPVIPVVTELQTDDGKAFGKLVYELPVALLTNELAGWDFQGDCVVLDQTGQVIFTCREDRDPNFIQVTQGGVQAGLGSTYRREYRDGQFLYSRSLGQNGWILVYSQTWLDIARGILPQLLISVSAAVAIIAMIWILLILISSRILKPALERSAQVFESEHLSRVLIESAPVGLALLDRDSGETLLRSPAMTHMQGQICAVDGSLSADLLHHYFQRADFASDRTLSQEMTFDTQDGVQVNLAVSMTPARFAGRDALVTMFINITDEKRLQQGLQEAKEAADRANAAKSSFLAVMSHEIRTPLNAILGNLELLTHSALDSQLARLAVIRRASDSLLAIISDVLDFSKIEAGELNLECVEFDALEVASIALSIFAPVAEAKGIKLSGRLSDTVTQPMQGDPTRLGQVLHNLLSNALKFTEKGQVDLRVCVDGDARKLLIEVQDTGIGMTDQQVEHAFRAFSQADESINRRYGGTGLGLALCMRITQAMGGTLSVRSEAGEGSIFLLSVPLGQGKQADRPVFTEGHVLVVAANEVWQAYLQHVLESWGLQVDVFQHPAQLTEEVLAQADALVLWGERKTWHELDERRLREESSWVVDCRADGAGDPRAEGHILHTTMHGLKGVALALRHILQAQPLPLGKDSFQSLPGQIHVLVAEDNAVNRQLFEEQLQLLGCTVALVENGELALRKLETESFDLLLTDLSMPVMDGYALADAARANWPHMPVFAATASVTSQEQERCRKAGIKAVLSKPLSLHELEHALRDYCHLSPVAPGVAMPVETADTGWLGGQGLPIQVLATFERSCLDALQVLRNACDSLDEQRILDELHSLRGALGVFRLEGLTQQAAALDAKVKAVGVRKATNNILLFCEDLEVEVLRHCVAAHALVERILVLAVPGAGARAISEIHRLGTALEQVLPDRSA
ncbi:hybrid sensor histidine kinase/response regulator [Pseudomonas koreensis]|uniref:hybrid sensor histidine kinase/response regulator n=1 Tax=Pseudomonas koreensis TaxID=198620 RepID=UPI0037F55978